MWLYKLLKTQGVSVKFCSGIMVDISFKDEKKVIDRKHTTPDWGNIILERHISLDCTSIDASKEYRKDSIWQNLKSVWARISSKNARKVDLSKVVTGFVTAKLC